MASGPPSQPLPSADALTVPADLPLVPRFHQLLAHARALVQHYGPYSLQANTAIFRRNTSSSTSLSTRPTLKDLAMSLAAAQDAHTTAQTEGPAAQDLTLFTALAQTSIAAIEQILEAGIPDGKAFGWGVYGLSSGFLPAMAGRSSADRSPLASSRDGTFFDDELFAPAQYSSNTSAEQLLGTRSPPTFDNLRERLHGALRALPSGNTGTMTEQGGDGREDVGQLTKKRNEVHLCATLLVQRLRVDDWKHVRWGHVVAVVETWLDHLG